MVVNAVLTLVQKETLGEWLAIVSSVMTNGSRVLKELDFILILE